MKICTRCGSEGRFFKDCTTVDGLSKWCAECRNLGRKNWRSKNPDKSRIQGLKKSGRTIESYARQFEEQKGLCALCGTPEPRGRLRGDHCHQAKLPRGLLCHRCNTGIGLLMDSPELLRAAATYIEFWRVQHSQDK